jgi:hypothetical protein
MNNATWEYDGRQWRRIETSSPPRRNAHGMVFDRKRSRVVVFGGFGPDRQSFGDTWEYDGSVWRPVSTTGPTPRGGHAMAFDATRGRVVLYGGSPKPFGGASLVDTWEWDGALWTQIPTTSHPTGNGLHRMAFDEKRSVVIAFGGRPINGETWAFDGRDWRLVTAEGPGPRDHHAMTYAPSLGKILMFGGFNPSVTGAFRDLWEWDGVRWTRAHADGPDDYGVHPGFVYDDSRRRALLFGSTGREGVPGFWQFDGRTWSPLQ